MTILLLQVFAGLALLFCGGELLVKGAVSIARLAKISNVVIGLTVVALGTSAPELVISLYAALGNHHDIAVGNVLGSNISNILFVLGITALIFPVIVEDKIAKTDAVIMTAITALVFLFCYLDNNINLLEGIILVLILAVYVIWSIRKARKEHSEQYDAEAEELGDQHNVWIALLLFIIGGAMLVYGSDVLVVSASELARVFGISEAVIGVTIVALGSSAPELATCAIAAYRKHSDIAIGNIVGSNLFNLAGIFGTTAIVIPMQVQERFINEDLPIVMLATAILLFIMLVRKNISRVTGISFILCYLLYITYQFAPLN